MLAVGVLDLGSGLGLAALPSLTLRLMGIAMPPPVALPYLAFVGVFVAALGLACLWAALGCNTRLRIMLQATLFFRLGAGLFTGLGAVLGWLPLGWLLVTGADAALVVIQVLLLRKGDGQDA
jgi:hypothetical protein